MMHTTNETRAYKELGGGVRRRIRSWGPEIMAVEVAFDAQGEGAVHAHPHAQLTYCLSGSFTFSVGSEQVSLRQGDTLYFPPDVPHGCVAHEDGLLLDVFTPMREDFVTADLK